MKTRAVTVMDPHSGASVISLVLLPKGGETLLENRTRNGMYFVIMINIDFSAPLSKREGVKRACKRKETTP